MAVASTPYTHPQTGYKFQRVYTGTTNTPLGLSLIVPATFTHNGRTVLGQWMIDTGASQTIIDDNTAAKLGIKGVYGRPITGVGYTPVKKQDAVIQNFNLGGLTKANLKVGIADVWGKDTVLNATITGIIGMDVLSLCNWGVNSGLFYIEVPVKG